jgi:NADH dehydrogenase
MILIAGGTSRLGTSVIPRLLEHGLRLRILTRNPERARQRWGDDVEIVQGDVRDPATLAPAAQGVETVISAIHGFAGEGNVSPRTIDWEGNINLIRAAEGAGVSHFILVSIVGASADHPMELFRMKYQAESALQRSSLAWTIIRPTAYMELWASIIGEPLLKTGKTRVFGRGNNPINFVSVEDVARFVELAVTNETMRGEIIEVGGPENLTMNSVAAAFKRISGRAGRVSHVPLPMMRVMARVMGSINAQAARQIAGGVVMDTTDGTFDSSETARRYPAITPTRFEDVIRRIYSDQPSGRNHGTKT